MSKKTAVPVAADPTDPFAHVGDPHWGQGGSYETDPVSGARRPVPEVAPESVPETPSTLPQE